MNKLKVKLSVILLFFSVVQVSLAKNSISIGEPVKTQFKKTKNYQAKLLNHQHLKNEQNVYEASNYKTFLTDQLTDKSGLFFSGGIAFPRTENQTNVQINDVVINHYFTDKKTNNEPVFALGVDTKFENIYNRPLNINVGLVGYYTDFGKINGLEYPFANDGSYDTLNYQFKAESYALILEPKFIYSKFNWQPYIVAGIGLGWNHLYNYNETPTAPDSSAVSLPTFFGNKTSTEFAYEGGAGIQHQILANYTKYFKLIGAVDYRYMNFGMGHLKPIPMQIDGHGIKISQLQMQSVIFTIKATS